MNDPQGFDPSAPAIARSDSWNDRNGSRRVGGFLSILLRRFDGATHGRSRHCQFSDGGVVFGVGRAGGIRTHDPLPPRQVRYQTALQPVSVNGRTENQVKCGLASTENHEIAFVA